MKSKTRKAAGKASLDPLVGPCPFCGATATTVRSPSGGPMQRLQHTADCYFGGAHLFVENDDRIEPWNRRANARFTRRSGAQRNGGRSESDC